MAVDMPIQPALVIARDTCLVIPKITEIFYNNVLVGPVLRPFGIYAPLNVTSMLKFGTGTKQVLRTIVYGTISGLPRLLKK